MKKKWVCVDWQGGQFLRVFSLISATFAFITFICSFPLPHSFSYFCREIYPLKKNSALCTRFSLETKLFIEVFTSLANKSHVFLNQHVSKILKQRRIKFPGFQDINHSV